MCLDSGYWLGVSYVGVASSHLGFSGFKITTASTSYSLLEGGYGQEMRSSGSVSVLLCACASLLPSELIAFCSYAYYVYMMVAS